MELEPKLFNPEAASAILGGIIKPTGLTDLAKKGLVPHHGMKTVFGKRIPLGFSQADLDFIMEQLATPAEPAKHPMVKLAERAEAPEPFRTTARSRALHGRKAA